MNKTTTNTHNQQRTKIFTELIQEKTSTSALVGSLSMLF